MVSADGYGSLHLAKQVPLYHTPQPAWSFLEWSSSPDMRNPSWESRCFCGVTQVCPRVSMVGHHHHSPEHCCKNDFLNCILYPNSLFSLSATFYVSPMAAVLRPPDQRLSELVGSATMLALGWPFPPP